MAATFCRAQGQCHTTIVSQGKPVGSATFIVKFLPDGHFMEEVDISAPKQKASNAMVAIYSRAGRPISMSNNLKAPNMSASISITFGPSSAKLVAHSTSQSKTQDMRYPAGAILDDPSIFWFSRDHPKPGATCKYTQFEPNSLRWRTLTDAYTGDTQLTYRGKKVTAHKLVNSDGTQFLDDRGLPYRIEAKDGSVFARD